MAESRPARRQGDPTKLRSTQGIEATGTYNIWYNKWSGFDKDHKSVDRAESRCSIVRDAGTTRAKGKVAFCLHFAHGTCVKGEKCSFYHRIPLPTDSFPVTNDCFGREKHRTEREDMSGVGSFEREGKVLYVANVANSPDAEKTVYKHFVEWGPIESVRFLTGRGIAFVRYRERANAEFAKEAMLGQSLDHNEVLNVKWANDDPNKNVKEFRKRKAEEIVKAAVLAKLPQIGDKGTLLDYEGAYEDADKRAKRIAAGESIGIGSSTPANGAPSNGYYYDSTGQVVSSGSVPVAGQDPESVQKAWAEYYAAGGTPEAASAYYAAYQNQGQGTGPTQAAEEETSEHVQDNSAYAVDYSNEQYAYPQLPVPQEEDEEERPPGTDARPGLGLVAYADSDED